MQSSGLKVKIARTFYGGRFKGLDLLRSEKSEKFVAQKSEDRMLDRLFHIRMVLNDSCKLRYTYR